MPTATISQPHPAALSATARNVLRHRESRGWNQRQLAELVGVTQAAVAHWETGHRHPRPRYVARLEAVLGVNLDQN